MCDRGNRVTDSQGSEKWKRDDKPKDSSCSISCEGSLLTCGSSCPVVQIARKNTHQKRPAKMAREARHFVDEAVFGAYFFEQFGQMDNWKCKSVELQTSAKTTQ